jgi:hypothetical protein
MLGWLWFGLQSSGGLDHSSHHDLMLLASLGILVAISGKLISLLSRAFALW